MARFFAPCSLEILPSSIITPDISPTPNSAKGVGHKRAVTTAAVPEGRAAFKGTRVGKIRAVKQPVTRLTARMTAGREAGGRREKDRLCRLLMFTPGEEQDGCQLKAGRIPLRYHPSPRLWMTRSYGGQGEKGEERTNLSTRRRGDHPSLKLRVAGTGTRSVFVSHSGHGLAVSRNPGNFGS
jgi:hypothetical protein